MFSRHVVATLGGRHDASFIIIIVACWCESVAGEIAIPVTNPNPGKKRRTTYNRRPTTRLRPDSFTATVITIYHVPKPFLTVNVVTKKSTGEEQ
eukprot:scaffold9209_cov157-Amphora_coffeaeformis.AAC.2